MTSLYRLRILITILLSIYSLHCHSQTYINGGEIVGKWEKRYSPYIITNNIIIPEYEELLIEPGVIIKSDPDCKIEVRGNLTAIGDQNDSILFTKNASDWWNGIRFSNEDSGQDSSILKYCIIEYGRHPIESYMSSSGGGISIKAPNVLISNCIIRHNKAYTGGGIGCYAHTKVVNTKIINNEAGYGAGIYVDGSSEFIGCVIAFNKANNPSAFIAKGYPLFKNCTIAYNESYGAGDTFSGNFRLLNSIVYYNSSENHNINIEMNEMPEFRYCNIQGGVSSIKTVYSILSGFFNGVYENCIDVEPRFIDGKNGDFRLIDSHCIDAGDPNTDIDDFRNDIDGNNRIYNGDYPAIDLGAFEYSQPTSNRQPYIVPQDTIFVFKNRSRNIVFPFYKGRINEEYNFNVYSDNDNLVVNLDTVNENSFTVQVTPKEKWSGVAKLIKQIRSSSDITNVLFQDTTFLVINNFIKGIISNDLLFYDTVRVIGDVLIDKQCKLTLEAGTYIEFQGPYQLSVLGEINVYGTHENYVEFNALDTIEMENDGNLYEQGWGGIRLYGSNQNKSTFQYCKFKNIGLPKYAFDNHNDGLALRYNSVSVVDYGDVVFNHCNFESNFNLYGDTQDDFYKYQALSCNLVVESSNAILNDCVFSNSYIGDGGASIYADSSTVTINRCLFKDFNYRYIGNSKGNSYCLRSSESNISITGSNFSNNDVGRYVIASFFDNKLNIKNCDFIRNSRVLELFTNEATIINNRFIDNGMAIESRNKINVIGNLIAHSKVICKCSNFFGTAINLESGSGKSLIANNTIVKNEQDSYGAAIYYSYSSPIIVNNIFWGNSNISSNEANIGGYNGAGLNIDDPVISNNFVGGDPLFNQSDTSDFRLTDQSPCINKANKELVGEILPNKDVIGNNRIDNLTGILDQGAFEYIVEIKNLKVNSIEPSNNENDIDIKSSIYVTFNAPIKIVNPKLIGLTNKDDSKIIELSEDKTVLIIKPQGFWDFDATQNLKIAEGAVCYIETETVVNKEFESLFHIRSCVRATISIESNDINYCPNTDVILSAISTGDSKEDYQWYFDNNETSISDGSKHQIFNFNQNEEGNYHCQITDLCGNSIKDSITISLKEEISHPTIKKKWGNVYFIDNDIDYYTTHTWYFNNNELAQKSDNVLIPTSGKGELFVTVQDLKSGCLLYSDTLVVQGEKNYQDAFVYPNPIKNNDILNVIIQTQYTRGIFQIFSIKGQELESSEFYQSNILTYDIADLKTGIYLLNLILDDRSKSFKLLIE